MNVLDKMTRRQIEACTEVLSAVQNGGLAEAEPILTALNAEDLAAVAEYMRALLASKRFAG